MTTTFSDILYSHLGQPWDENAGSGESLMNGSMPSWEEWDKQMSEDQRKYSLYKILQSMDQSLSLMKKHCPVQAEICDERFEKLEDRKKIDTSVAAVTGVIGGILAWIGTNAARLFR